jgi:hypothetical protein
MKLRETRLSGKRVLRHCNALFDCVTLRGMTNGDFVEFGVVVDSSEVL